MKLNIDKLKKVVDQVKADKDFGVDEIIELVGCKEKSAKQFLKNANNILSGETTFEKLIDKWSNKTPSYKPASSPDVHKKTDKPKPNMMNINGKLVEIKRVHSGKIFDRWDLA